MIHFAEPLPPMAQSIRVAAGLPTHGLCTNAILANNWTSNPDDVTCPGCMFALLWVMQQQQTKLLEKFSKLSVKLSSTAIDKVTDDIGR